MVTDGLLSRFVACLCSVSITLSTMTAGVAQAQSVDFARLPLVHYVHLRNHASSPPPFLFEMPDGSVSAQLLPADTTDERPALWSIRPAPGQPGVVQISNVATGPDKVLAMSTRHSGTDTYSLKMVDRASGHQTLWRPVLSGSPGDGRFRLQSVGFPDYSLAVGWGELGGLRVMRSTDLATMIRRFNHFEWSYDSRLEFPELPGALIQITGRPEPTATMGPIVTATLPEPETTTGDTLLGDLEVRPFGENPERIRLGSVDVVPHRFTGPQFVDNVLILKENNEILEQPVPGLAGLMAAGAAPFVSKIYTKPHLIGKLIDEVVAARAASHNAEIIAGSFMEYFNAGFTTQRAEECSHHPGVECEWQRVCMAPITNPYVSGLLFEQLGIAVGTPEKDRTEAQQDLVLNVERAINRQRLFVAQKAVKIYEDKKRYYYAHLPKIPQVQILSQDYVPDQVAIREMLPYNLTYLSTASLTAAFGAFRMYKTFGKTFFKGVGDFSLHEAELAELEETIALLTEGEVEVEAGATASEISELFGSTFLEVDEVLAQTPYVLLEEELAAGETALAEATAVSSIPMALPVTAALFFLEASIFLLIRKVKSEQFEANLRARHAAASQPVDLAALFNGGADEMRELSFLWGLLTRPSNVLVEVNAHQRDCDPSGPHQVLPPEMVKGDRTKATVYLDMMGMSSVGLDLKTPFHFLGAASWRTFQTAKQACFRTDRLEQYARTGVGLKC